jgi:ribonuclease J
MNAYSEMGVDVVDDHGGMYHVSGHANRPDLEAVHDLMRPRILIPMHGEHRHLREHARIAAERGIASEVAVNGTMLDLTGDAPVVVEYIETGRTYLDGTALIGAMDGVVRDRIRLALNGHVIVTVILDEADEPLGDPWVEVMGLPAKGRSGSAILDELEREVGDLLGRLNAKVLTDDDALDEAITRAVRQVAQEEIGKKPEVTIVISRLMAE